MNLRNYFTLLFVVHSCLLCYANSQFRIVDGKSVNIEAIPYMVSLHYEKNFKCAGSLISMEKVITAAHCLKDTKAKLFVVKAGVTNIVTETGQCRTVKKIIIPDYKRNTKNMDIGAIKVSEPFIQSPQVNYITICSTELRPGKPIKVSGWGSTSVYSTDHVAELRTIIVPIVGTSECANRYQTIGRTLTKSMMCAGMCGSGAARGDSGGPGVVGGELCAVVSFGRFREIPAFPVVFTNITYKKVLKFIQKVMTW
ncbi:seminase-like [Eurosta solidaginis]|uniref:seminase-like n=1 Tax=Eurosta solidaginis TaxID=178769 RepID=UPI003531240C